MTSKYKSIRAGRSLQSSVLARRKANKRLVAELAARQALVRPAGGSAEAEATLPPPATAAGRERAGGAIPARSQDLALAYEELEAFSYSVYHDLRAPLRRIVGFSQVLAEDFANELGAQGKDYLHRIRAAGQRMDQIIQDLFKLARLTQRELHREPVDLSGLARTIALELQQAEPNRRVQFHIADGLVTHGDGSLLRIALENVLGNAWKYTRDQPNARIAVGRSQQGASSVYFVRDNGAGFDMSGAHRLFNPFQRLHSAAEFEGAGIGLATVHRIVQRHGGHIWAEGAVGQGATFFFTLGDG